MRLVDADAILVHMADWYCYDDRGSETTLKQVIENAPTVESDIIKHGRWIQGELYIKCSECGYPAGHLSDNYCPNCGAKMDKE